MSSNIQNELSKQHNSLQEKLIYFLLAVAASAIGFSTTQIKIEALSYTHIPLGLSLIFWAISFYSGIKFLRSHLGAIYINYGHVTYNKEKNNYQSEQQKEIEENFNEATNKESENIQFFGVMQYNCLYLGVFFYVCWYILRMCAVAA